MIELLASSEATSVYARDELDQSLRRLLQKVQEMKVLQVSGTQAELEMMSLDVTLGACFDGMWHSIRPGLPDLFRANGKTSPEAIKSIVLTALKKRSHVGSLIQISEDIHMFLSEAMNNLWR